MANTTETGTTTFLTPSDVESTSIRVVEAPRQLVWDVWTRPEHVRRWLLGYEGWTVTVCEIDLRPGGAWRYAWEHPEQGVLEMKGVYVEVSPPERLVNTESWGEEWPETTNTLVLTEEDGKTTITLTVRYPSKEARDQALATGANDGMNESYGHLEALLRSLHEKG